MKRIFVFVICLIMLFSLVSCDNGAENSLPVSEPEESPVITYPEKILINGVDLKEFTIVYCNSTTFDGYNHYRLIVDEINGFLEEHYGYTLNAVADTVGKTEHEILVGFTYGRELRNAFDRDSFEAGQYALVVKETKVMLAGAYANGWHNAFEKFKSVIAADDDGNLTDFMTEGKLPVVKVACVGDSITQGVNSASNQYSYPAYLQQLLGWDYCVLNAGLSGYSICNNDPYAYCNSKQYSDAIKFEPDVVIFALGTNDSNPGQDWKDWSDPDRKDLFLDSARELLDSFYAAKEDVQIFICLPTPLFDGRGGWDAPNWNKNLEAYSLPLIKQIAEEYELPQVDLHSWGLENDSVFTDGLHPKNETYGDYAKAVYDRIYETIKKAQ